MSVETELPVDRAQRAREGRWSRLLEQVDPGLVMTLEDREDAARKLRREQLTEFGRLGRAKQVEKHTEYRLFLERKDELIRLHEEILDQLRTVA